jgi:two-component system, OmpR family, response regulator
MLPGMDGYQIAKRLRDERVTSPILILTARDATPDIVKGLDGGADDYLTKPFAFEVLLARLRALARRGTASSGPVLEIGPLRLDPATREVVRAGQQIVLTRTEFQLLEYLMRRPGQVIPRRTLIESVWGHERDIEGNTLDAFVRLLRAKVEREGSRLIQTARGVGYSIRDEEIG